MQMALVLLMLSGSIRRHFTKCSFESYLDTQILHRLPFSFFYFWSHIERWSNTNVMDLDHQKPEMVYKVYIDGSPVDPSIIQLFDNIK